MKRVSRGIDRIEVTFDDDNLVPNAGLLLVSTLVARLGLEELVNTTSSWWAAWAGLGPGARS